MRERLEPVVSAASLLAAIVGILLIATPLIRLGVEWAFAALGY